MSELETVWTGASWRNQPLPEVAKPAPIVFTRMEEKRARILHALKGGIKRTRLGLAESTGLTRAQTSETLSKLIKEKLVRRFRIHRGPALYQRIR